MLESLAFALADPGDVFVANFPMYPRFAKDISERAQIKLMGLVLNESEDFKPRSVSLSVESPASLQSLYAALMLWTNSSTNSRIRDTKSEHLFTATLAILWEMFITKKPP